VPSPEPHQHPRVPGQRADHEVAVGSQRGETGDRAHRVTDARQQRSDEAGEPAQRLLVDVVRASGRGRHSPAAVLGGRDPPTGPRIAVCRLVVGREPVARRVVHPDPHRQPVGAEPARLGGREVGDLLARHGQRQRLPRWASRSLVQASAASTTRSATYVRVPPSPSAVTSSAPSRRSASATTGALSCNRAPAPATSPGVGGHDLRPPVTADVVEGCHLGAEPLAEQHLLPLAGPVLLVDVAGRRQRGLQRRHRRLPSRDSSRSRRRSRSTWRTALRPGMPVTPPPPWVPDPAW